MFTTISYCFFGFSSLNAVISAPILDGPQPLRIASQQVETASRLKVGAALAESGYRNKVFLVTKIDGRNNENATDQINDSLGRLKTDSIDLLQLHEILRFDDPDRIFREGGALEAALAAKKAGKIRFICFTGHKDPRIHLYMLEVAAKITFGSTRC